MIPVIFHFDKGSMRAVQALIEALNYRSIGEVLKTSFEIFSAIAKLHKQGYTEIIVRNPGTKEEREIILREETRTRLSNQS